MLRRGCVIVDVVGVCVASLERYMLYLDSIVTNSEGEYDEIDAVLMRYRTLEEANKVVSGTVTWGAKG